jgi:hypothetical protein
VNAICCPARTATLGPWIQVLSLSATQQQLVAPRAVEALTEQLTDLEARSCAATRQTWRPAALHGAGRGSVIAAAVVATCDNLQRYGESGRHGRSSSAAEQSRRPNAESGLLRGVAPSL